MAARVDSLDSLKTSEAALMGKRRRTACTGSGTMANSDSSVPYTSLNWKAGETPNCGRGQRHAEAGVSRAQGEVHIGWDRG